MRRRTGAEESEREAETASRLPCSALERSSSPIKAHGLGMSRGLSGCEILVDFWVQAHKMGFRRVDDMESKNSNEEFRELVHSVETIRHLADREHDYVYSRSNYFILSETILLTAFILAIDKPIGLSCLLYIPIALSGLFISCLWIKIGYQSKIVLKVVRRMVAGKKNGEPEGYEDLLTNEKMKVYKKYREKRPRSGLGVDSILLLWIPVTFVILWISMLFVALHRAVPLPFVLRFY
jgi:hypothetical protein